MLLQIAARNISQLTDIERARHRLVQRDYSLPGDGLGEPDAGAAGLAEVGVDYPHKELLTVRVQRRPGFPRGWTLIPVVILFSSSEH